jgi:hypothetical protein
MGQGRVDPASPASINSDPKGRKRRGRNDKKQGGKPRERERERNDRNSRNQKPRISTGRPRETDREKEKKDRRGNPAGEEDTDWCLYIVKKKRCCYH